MDDGYSLNYPLSYFRGTTVMVITRWKDCYIRHEREFKDTFGRSMRPFMDFVTGFDVIMFDEFVKPAANQSCADAVEQKFGPEGLVLIHKLLNG